MNENKLAVFSNPDFGEVRTLEINGEPWFVGKDVAQALGYARERDAIATHVDADDAVKYGVTDSLGRAQETTIINESGLYSLIMSSKMEKAKEFKRWVTSEVLPSIRKTGAYSITQTVSDKKIEAELAKANATVEDAKARQATEKRLQAELILRVAEKMNLSPEANQTLMAYTVEMMTGVKALPLPEVEKTYSAGEVGEMFGVSANKIGRVANAKGLKTEKYGIFVLDKARGHNKQVQTFRYNQTAVEFFRDYFGGDE